MLLRYGGEDSKDFESEVSFCLRVCPPLSACTPERLCSELAAIAEHLAALETPDFSTAARIERVCQGINKGLLANPNAQTDCMRQIAEGILQRKKHRKYLLQIQVRSTARV